MKLSFGLLLISILFSAGAWADVDVPSRTPGAATLQTQADAWTTFKNNSEASYYVSLAGQSLGEAQVGASYNPYARSKWPMQFYSALYYGYKFAPNWTLGMELSGAWNFVGGVSNQFGEIETGAALFQPAVQLKRANMIDVDWLNVFGQMQVFLPTSQFMREKQTFLFSVAFDNTWTVRALKAPWSVGVTTKIQASFYEQTVPGPFEASRETFYLSAGHFLNYSFSEHFQLQTSTQFDTNHWGGSSSLLDFDVAQDDRWKVQFSWFPRIPVFNQAGIFVQGLIFNPMLATTIVGMDFTLRM